MVWVSVKAKRGPKWVLFLLLEYLIDILSSLYLNALHPTGTRSVRLRSELIGEVHCSLKALMMSQRWLDLPSQVVTQRAAVTLPVQET
jgi:hypothetical protein